jgi:hypothetical protein
MPCLLVLLAIFLPRVVIVLLFLFSNWLGQAYAGVPNIWPVLGFIFMPFTTLAYALAMHGAGAVEGIYLILLILAVIMDVGSWGGGAHRARD